MGVASRPPVAPSRTRRNRVALIGAVLVVIVLALPGWTGPTYAVGTTDPPTPHSTAAVPLLAAEASLSQGLGPAAGGASTCTPSGGLTVDCAAPLHRPPASSPSPVWSDLTNKLGSNVPGNRWLGTMAYDPLDHYVVLFGGDNESQSSAYSDTWTYANGSWTLLSPSNSPPPRYAASMAWDAADGYMVLFGGHDYPSNVDLNDTWTFVHGQWTPAATTGPAPSPRWRQAMAYDATDGYVVLFGGADNLSTPTAFSDTWKFVGGAWTDITHSVTGNPPGRYRASMVWDAADGYLLLFGGCTSSTCPDQSTWTYVGGAWTQKSPTVKPAARVYVGLTYDDALGEVVLFGGASTSTLTVGLADTWTYLNGTWTQLSSVGTSPSTRAYVMMAFDPNDNYTILFGGANPSNQAVYFSDTWAFGPSIIGKLTVGPSAIDLGQQTLLNASPLAAKGVVTYDYTALPPGCTSANLSLLACTPVSEGNYSVGVMLTTTTGSSVNESASLVVGSDPEITSYASSNPVVTAGTGFTLTTTVVNGTAPYHYSYTGLPSGCASTNLAVLACTPTTATNATIEVIVNDAANFHVFDNVSVTVNARPSLATFTASPATIDAGQSTTFYANVSGGTAPFTYNYTGLPGPCVSSNVSALSCTPTVTGIARVSVDVTDAFGWSAFATFDLTVNAGPSISEFAAEPLAIDVGQSINFWLNASGGTGTLSYSYTGLPQGCNLGVASTGTCVTETTGTYNVTGTVTDSLGASVSSVVTVVIAADPQVESVTAIPAMIDAGQTTSIQVVVSGGTAPFTYSYTGLPLGCTGTTTLTVNCTVRSSGIFTVVATVSDHWHQPSQLSTSLTVNAAPKISSFNASVAPVTVNSPTVFQVVTTGGDGGNSYVYTGLPAGCASQNSSTASCTPTTTGSFNVTVTVTDALGVVVTASTNLTVESAPSGTSPFSGGGGALPWILIAVAVLVVIAAVVLLMRRRKQPPAVAPAASAASDPAWSESDGPST